MAFELPMGIDIRDISGLKAAYEISRENGDRITAVIGADRLMELLRGFTRAISEPIFFFIELPCTSEEEKQLGDGERCHYRLYYLDNCTEPVISAILDEYGSLLINDGICRFGFGGNESGDEIYVQSYKVTDIFCMNDSVKRRAPELLERLGAEKTDKLVTPWDVVSPQNEGVCMRVDEDGLTVYDIPELLKDAGMYFAEIRE